MSMVYPAMRIVYRNGNQFMDYNDIAADIVKDDPKVLQNHKTLANSVLRDIRYSKFFAPFEKYKPYWKLNAEGLREAESLYGPILTREDRGSNSEVTNAEEQGCRTGAFLAPEICAPPYNFENGDSRQLVERQIKERRGQPEFRNALRSRYGDRCQVTPCEILAVLEAAHIRPYRGENDNNPENGLLLRTDIHTLFDLDLIGIEPACLRVEIHPDIAEHYGYLKGLTLRCVGDARPSRQALYFRYELFTRRLGTPAK